MGIYTACILIDKERTYMEQEKNKLIQFRHIVKEFDGQVVLKGIDLDIYENELYYVFQGAFQSLAKDKSS